MNLIFRSAEVYWNILVGTSSFYPWCTGACTEILNFDRFFIKTVDFVCELAIETGTAVNTACLSDFLSLSEFFISLLLETFFYIFVLFLTKNSHQKLNFK